MKRLFLLLSFLVLFTVSGTKAHACMCNLIWPDDMPESSYPAMKKYFLEEFKGAVFVGKVLRIEKVKVNWPGGVVMSMKKVTIKVEQSWVGANSSEISIYSLSGGCYKGYRKGQSYFFFAEVRENRLDDAEGIPSSLDNKVINSFKKWFGQR